MANKKILLTGGTGRLGSMLLKMNILGKNVLAPDMYEMDITSKKSVFDYFKKHKIGIVVHCAALTDLKECERNPASAVESLITGTSNVVEAASKQGARFVYISTDYVYPGTKGPYKETDETIPFTVYGWGKLGGECAVRTLKDYCIIRTSFFEPENIPFDTAPTDAYFSKVPISSVAEAVGILLKKNFKGVINVGQKKDSMYNILKKYKPSMKPVGIKDLPSSRAKDSSMDVRLWEKIKKRR